MNMEGLDFVTLYLALTPSQAEAVLNGLGAMPQESSKRFGLRTNKMAAVQRSQYFHEWEARYGSGENPGLTHKDFVVVTMRITSFGFVSAFFSCNQNACTHMFVRVILVQSCNYCFTVAKSCLWPKPTKRETYGTLLYLDVSS